MPKVFFETFGCQMNVADSGIFADVLSRQGFATTQSRDEADLVIVNTCSVRQHAEQRAMARLREFGAHIRKKQPGQRLWVTGCMAERMGTSLREQIPEIEHVIGATRIEYLDSFIGDLLHDASGTDSAARPDSPVSVFVPVMRGCDNFCTYCIVPHVRGREHSIAPACVEKSVRGAVDRGAREVTLLGQNVNSYASEGCDFSDLLRRVHDIDGLLRIRFVTSHPKDCSERLVRAMAELPKVCKHLHLPAQSGSTRILAAMNRRYTREHYLRLAESVRAQVRSIDLTTDVMVGFPGETEEDFEQTFDFMRIVRFTSAFMFAYSVRPGTAAESLGDTVSAAVKTERLSRIVELQTAITKEYYAAAVGSEVQLLVTGRQEGRDRLWIALDRGAKSALVSCRGNPSGTILRATVERTTGMTLVCKEFEV
jgi:tRNA-2-methylthio-N6-dimethylallyladenosine synthase